MASEQAVLDALRGIKDPESQKDIVALGLVRDVAVRGGEVSLTLAFAGQRDEARKMVDVALEAVSTDPVLLTRASTLLLSLKDVPAAVARARRAVETSQGGDARAQFALGEALAASGDAAGATAALSKAAELDPENAATRKRLEALRAPKGKKGAKAT